MRILITGSEGTLGKSLAKELKLRGHIVFGMDLKHCEGRGLDGYIRGDVSNYRQVFEAFKRAKPEYVYHLAAEFGRHNGEEYYEQLWLSNAVGTKNVLRGCHEFGVRLIFSSSSEIYGEGDYWDTEILDEDMSSRVPLRQHNDYAISKWVNELQICNQFKIYPDQEIMTLRFFNAYGPGEYYHPYRSVCCLFVYNAMHRLPCTIYQGYHRVFMYIDDFIPTLANCVEKFVSKEIVNIGGTEYRSIEDLHNVISDLLSLPRQRPEISYLSKDGHNTINKRPDISKAKKLLGHDPKILLEEGIARTIDWQRKIYEN